MRVCPRGTRTLQPSLLFAAALLSLGVACGGGTAPVLPAVSDQIAEVGTEFDLELQASDQAGDDISYTFSADIPGISSRATLTRSPAGTGIFRWTPIASDVGMWYFDFTATNSSKATTITVMINVKSAIGSDSAPIFREPLGTGTTLNLAVASCIDVSIVVDDETTTDVDIAQEDPTIDGATIMSTGDLMSTWHWCPSAEQIADDDRYTLILSADDHNNPKTILDYLIVLQSPNMQNCPGAPPVVTHTPMDQSTILDPVITATITDDVGLRQAPLLYYSYSDPGATPNVATMTQLTMALSTGDMQSGTWDVAIPNPVVTSPVGTTGDIYYVIDAEDNDDPSGNCDHTTQGPATGSYHMVVTNDGSGAAGLCNACAHDAQCGTGGNLCVRVGASQDSFCLQSCDGGAGECPTGYSCSASALTSVDGTMGRQCTPDTSSCAAGGVCVDDMYEPNDSRSEASANPAFAPGTYMATSCPAAGGTSDNEDWYKIVTTGTEDRVNINLTGMDSTNLDLGLYKSNGDKVTASTSSTSNEQISECLHGATYYIRVYTANEGTNNYTLEWDKTPETCITTCTDDSNEDDDTRSQARIILTDDYTSTGDVICPNDDDFFHVSLATGSVMTVDLTFDQTSEAGNLDLHLLDATGNDLTPCSPASPATCTAADGQGDVSNEHYVFTTPAGCDNDCDYYVVVRGFNGATNSYSIHIGVQ